MNQTGRSANDRYKIKVLEKAFRILDLYSETTYELTATEIAERVRFNKTSVFRIITNLEEAGFLEKDPATLKYRLGLKIFFMGSLVKPFTDLKRVAKPWLKKLNTLCGETVHLAALQDGEALYLDKIESSRTIRVAASRVGQKLPAHCSGVGKVLLANIPPDETEAIVAEKGLKRFTDKTITTWERLSEELSRVRKQGYAFDNEEIEEELKCVAAPIFVNKQVVAAISASVPKERFNRSKDELTDLVIATAKHISDDLKKLRKGNF